MPYDYKALFSELSRAVGALGPIQARMRAVVSYCATCCPHDGWADMLEIDYEADCSRIGEWVSGLHGRIDSESVRGAWFGLVTLSTGSDESADVFPLLSETFTPDSNEWAISEQSIVGPFLGSTVLSRVYKLAYSSETGLGWNAEYPLVLAYGSMVAMEIMRSGALLKLFPRIQGAAAGFDSGDYFLLGTVREAEFVPDVRVG